jgi:hypothetical protein
MLDNNQHIDTLPKAVQSPIYLKLVETQNSKIKTPDTTSLSPALQCSTIEAAHTKNSRSGIFLKSAGKAIQTVLLKLEREFNSLCLKTILSEQQSNSLP